MGVVVSVDYIGSRFEIKPQQDASLREAFLRRPEVASSLHGGSLGA